MTRWQWLARTVAFSAVILAIACLSGAIWAESQLEYPRPCPGGCVPNAKGFGHFPTNWRRWPGEPREDETNPRAVDSEVLRTPEGRKETSLPKAAPLQPYQQPMPQPPQPRQQMEPSQPRLPPQGPLAIPTPEGELPTEGATIRPQIETLLPPIPPEGQGTKPTTKPSKPLIEEGDLPGLDEPTPPKRPSPPKGKTSYLTPVLKDAAVVSLSGNLEPERNALPPSVYRADPIGVVPMSSVNRIQPAGYATAESPARQKTASAKTVPTVALGGYCPVELSRSGRWVLGDLRWTVVHQGWIYRLSGAEQRQQFLADPDRFAPANSGSDVVLLAEKNRVVPGRTAHCAIYGGRLYMFSSADTQTEFNRHPGRYVAGK
jgi:YHS domain-containing protein